MTVDIYFHPKKYKDGQQPVMLRFSALKKSFYKVLFRAYPEDWDAERKLIKKTHSASKYLNSLIMQELSAATLRLAEQRARGSVLPNDVLGKETPQGEGSNIHDQTIDFLANQYLEDLEPSVRYQTYKARKSSLLSAIEPVSKVKVREFEKSHLNEIVTYLRGIGNKGNTIHGKIKRVNGMLSWAEDKYHINLKFPKTQIVREPVYKEALDLLEIQSIENLEIQGTGRKFDTKNIFLTQFYLHGSRISDVLLLEKSSIKKNTVELIQRKTGKMVSVDRHEKLNNILRQYEDTEGRFVFSFMEGIEKDENILNLALSTKALNSLESATKKRVEKLRKKIASKIDSTSSLVRRLLSEIAEEAKIKKKIGSHTARHSFATIADRLGVPISQLSAALGHSTINQTQSYIKQYKFHEISKATSIVYRGEAPKGEDS